MKIQDVIEILEDYAPLSLQEEYDNSGLLIGDREKEVSRVLIALDINDDIINEASAKGVNFIITHHPLIFNPVKYITTDDLRGELILKIIKNDISVYAAHTNVDNTDENIAWEFADGIGAEDICPLKDSSGVKASVKAPITFREMVEKVRTFSGDSNIRSIGNFDDTVEEICFLNGAQGGNEDLLVLAGSECDVVITSEIKYHIAVMAKQLGINMIEIGHYESEKCFIDLIERKLKEKIEQIDIIKSEYSVSPYNYKGDSDENK